MNSFRDEIRVKCTLYFHLYCKSRCFWRNLQHWQKILHCRRHWRHGQISPLWGTTLFFPTKQSYGGDCFVGTDEKKKNYELTITIPQRQVITMLSNRWLQGTKINFVDVPQLVRFPRALEDQRLPLNGNDKCHQSYKTIPLFFFTMLMLNLLQNDRDL